MTKRADSSIYRRIGENAYSGVLSNLGCIVVPSSVEPHIESFGFLINPSFGSIVVSSDFERGFFTRLAAEGLRVAVSER